MSRRYWSSDPSSYEDFRCGLGFPLIRAPAPSARDSCRDETREGRRRDGAPFLSLNRFSEPLPPNSREPGEAFRGVRCIAVVDRERATLDERVRHEAPVPAVEGVVPVVAEDEVVPLWDDQRAPVVSRRRRRASGPGRTDQIIPLPLELVAGGVHRRISMHRV